MAGTFSNYAASSCSTCLPGYFSDSGASVCTICTPGYFSWTSGATTCSPCPNGAYAAIAGADVCELCGPGSSSGIGATSCTSCFPGTFAAISGSLACVLCGPGTYGPGFGSVDCTFCDAGKYVNSTGSTSTSQCQQCSVDRITLDGIAATSGGSTLYIYGANFPPIIDGVSSYNITLGGRYSCDQVVWISSSALTCQTPPGVGTNLELSIQAQNYVTLNAFSFCVINNPQLVAFAYSAPLIETIQPTTFDVGTSVTITVQGNNFGSQASDVQIFVGM